MVDIAVIMSWWWWWRGSGGGGHMVVVVWWWSYGGGGGGHRCRHPLSLLMKGVAVKPTAPGDAEEGPLMSSCLQVGVILEGQC
jgi:hypothetical protein